MVGSILTGVGLAAAGAVLDTVLLRTGRNIAGFIPDCTIEERHKDELEITQNPVEQGSPISDHAFMRPVELMMRVAWSDSKNLSQLLKGAIQGTRYPDNIYAVYSQLQLLQSSIEPFSITTGKRTYNNMLMASLQVVTNKETENSLMVEALFREVIIVSTQVQSASSLGATADQANPQNTAAPVSTGSQSLGTPNATAAATIGTL